MAAHDLIRILPMLIIAAGLVVIMLGIAFRRNHLLTLFLALTSLVCSFFSLYVIHSGMLPQGITPLFIMDDYALFFIGLLLAAAFAITLISYDYLKALAHQPEEYYVLLLIATLGAMVLTASNHFASFFLGLETLSIPLYILISYPLTKSTHIEAGIKYLVLSAASAAFLVFGMALIYARLGTMELKGVAAYMSAVPDDLVLLSGFIMMLVGIGFKLGIVPFHMWTPDVYEGAPAPVTAFIATVSKGAVFSLLMRYFRDINISPEGSLFIIFSIIAGASMFLGNLLALLQNNMKRLLAYSSIAHFGYLLVAFLASGPMKIAAAAFYLVAYFITTIGAFGIVTILSERRNDADSLDDYSGLYSHKPFLALTFTLMLLSLAGIPLTAGFIGKFLIITAGITSSQWLLVTMLVLNSGLGLFYYLRVIVTIFLNPLHGVSAVPPRITLVGSLVIASLVILLVWWGVYPTFLTNVIQHMASGV
jgi:NADH-quinone oxidoreductase subunit N